MEKYAVVTGKGADGAKTAASKSHCPKCGGPLQKSTNVPKCLKCGTKPFERKPDGEKEKA